jgi:hypothetical protein
LDRPVLDLRAADAVSRQCLDGGDRRSPEREKQRKVSDEMAAHVAEQSLKHGGSPLSSKT